MRRGTWTDAAHHRSRRRSDGAAVDAAHADGRGFRAVRALEPSAPYCSRLSARSALYTLYTDLHVLLDAACEPLTSAAYRSLVIEDNCVARKSARAGRKIWKELKASYSLDTGHPLFAGVSAGVAPLPLRTGTRPDRLYAPRPPRSSGRRPRHLLVVSAPATGTRGAPRGQRARVPRSCGGEARGGRRLVGSHAHRRGPEIRAQRPRLRLGQRHGQEDHGSSRSLRRAGPALVRALSFGGVRPLDLVCPPIFRLLALEGHEVMEDFSEPNPRDAARFRTHRARSISTSRRSGEAQPVRRFFRAHQRTPTTSRSRRQGRQFRSPDLSAGKGTRLPSLGPRTFARGSGRLRRQ